MMGAKQVLGRWFAFLGPLMFGERGFFDKGILYINIMNVPTYCEQLVETYKMHTVKTEKKKKMP
jgi:hypothetical protein